MVAARMGIAALPHKVVESVESAGSGGDQNLGDGLWSRLYAAVRDGDQRQAVTEAFIRFDAGSRLRSSAVYCGRGATHFDAPTAKRGSQPRACNKESGQWGC